MLTHKLTGTDRPEATEQYIAILRRDPCSYCGAPSTSNHYGLSDVDHIRPQRRGGADRSSNMTAACSSCNSSKHTKTLLGFLLSRLYAPEKAAAEAVVEQLRLQGRVGL